MTSSKILITLFLFYKDEEQPVPWLPDLLLRRVQSTTREHVRGVQKLLSPHQIVQTKVDPPQDACGISQLQRRNHLHRDRRQRGASGWTGDQKKAERRVPTVHQDPRR